MSPDQLVCRLCGQGHRVVLLVPRERALCVRCGTLLARGSRPTLDVPLAFTISGLILAAPAGLLPLMSVAKFGSKHTSLLLTGIGALWREDMSLLAGWVLWCGALAPVFMLGTLAGLLLPMRFGRRPPAASFLLSAARAIEQWAMADVQMLAVLVAFSKLGSMVNVTVEPGFWFYAGAALATLLAWRSFDLESAARNLVSAESGAAASRS